ncbi:hydroxylamine reductase [Acidocella aminolytica]|uniref:Hydroxylamine reductase n=1 Tax=Acidocella aminolytica 101 = DSM 11237 TaxID=1120923 RepID=A0A0D6PJ21_9PROT|nr:hydroxylamine reductase [Acidocella aminolytica]GAN81662.1 hydroxylamine reductase [Acidocella aminolytica 101 = DSM 11237]SHF53582.1 hydroxylamine reductase precursor [Acidocella aminolytica 101 = DSM 11237]
MFCFQCEQTAHVNGQAGCASTKGVCGKDETTADLQDLLIYQLKGIGQLSERLRALGKPDQAADSFTLYALFTTLTNVNFNRAVFTGLIAEAARIRDRLRDALAAAGGDVSGLSAAVSFQPATDLPGLLAQANIASVRAGLDLVGEDVIGLRALILYGLKGVAAYAHHAEVLGEARDEIYAGVAHALAFLATDPDDINALLAEALALGRLNFTVMEVLDAANTGRFGAPVPTQVLTTPVAGKAILVSGHDLRDLHNILEATKDKGINVYTHGEMLPAHGYPKLHAYPHLVGNYGTAWQNQQQEFAAFPGPIVMTSNCLIEPQPAYRNRIFTAGPVGWPGIRHIQNDDYAQVIQAAQAMPGFAEAAPAKTIQVGFARETVLGAAETVINAVKSGDIRHFFLIGGCDGAAPGRNYYTDFADHAPKDTMLLTLGCGKYRFNMHDHGEVAGLPRLLDVGQCNDTYSAIQIATALANAFGCGVNDLPLTLVVSWFEQKAAAVLLTLLALGVRNVRLGPSLPAFLTPTLLNVLVEKFGVQPITTAEADIQAALTRQAA